MSSSAPALRAVLPALALGAAACSLFQREVPEFRDGIAAYKDSKWADAEGHFDRALAAEPTSEGHFDKGAALLKQQKPQDAVEQFRRALGTRDDALRARAYLDLGNAEAQGGRLDPAIEAYRRSLELVPTDADARYNLEWALLQKKKAQEQQDKKDGQPQAKNDKQEQQDPKDEKKDEKDGDKNDKDEQKQEEKKDGQAKSDQEKADEEKQQGRQPQQPKPDESGQQQADARQQPSGSPGQEERQGQAPRPLTRQEAGEILEALQAGEKNLQMWRFQEKQGDRRERTKLDKDW